MFIGRISDLSLHSTVTTAAVIGLDNDVNIRIEGEDDWIKSRSFIFEGSLSHESAYRGRIGILLADPGSDIGEIFSQELGSNRLAMGLSWELEFIKMCFGILEAPSPDYYRDIFFQAFPFSRLVRAKSVLGDERLFRILRHLVVNPEESFNIDQLAEMIGMSPSWLQHEFKNAVGLPLRAFRKWFRIRTSVVAMKRGSSIAEAALIGGFYDQAHFTNVFREIFGISPSLVFSRGEPIRWFVEDEILVDKLNQPVIGDTII
ncbi:MAG: AraC family transcriptional regulator [Leptospira sp.]|nr:AraC family transcriptional regulator [Leptospira sp.]